MSSETKQISLFRGMDRLTDFAAAVAEAGEATELTLVRRRAAALCSRQSWPTPKDEEWRRSRVEAFEFDKMSLVLPASAKASGQSCLVAAGSPDAALLLERAQSILAHPAALGEDNAPRLANLAELAAFAAIDMDGSTPSTIRIAGSEALTRDGAIVAPLSSLAASCAATVGAPFAQKMSQKAAAILAAALERAESSGDNRFISWNSAAWNAGIMVYVPRNTVIDRPVVIDWQLRGEDCVHQPLLVVVAEEGASLEVIQRFQGDGGYLVNAASHLAAGANAKVRLTTIQEIGKDAVWIANGHAAVGRDTRFRHTDINLGSGFAKTRFTADINGSGSDVHLDGLYFADDSQHMDLRSVQNHNAPNATSRAFFKGVVRDEARTVYQGLILVAPQAGGTDAFLTNRNLVLNDGARSDSIPTLQIRTNDVRCSHGSTTGKIDPEEVFYLQNRGFSRTEAEIMIVTAYLDEVANGLPDLIRDHIHDKVADRVRRGS